jgi:Methyltransferase domain
MRAPQDLVYLNYWKRKQLSRSVPTFPIRRHWRDGDQLSEVQEIIYDAIKNSSSVLDVGAGDLRLMRLLGQRGYGGVYHTQDIGREFAYTYSSLDEVGKTYGAVLCIDVLEHLTLEDGLSLLHRLLSLLERDGVLVMQTANANFVRHPLAWDMTHLHAYNPQDLWTYLTALGVDTTVYRVIFGRPGAGLKQRLHEWLRAKLCEELTIDHCQNILIVGRKAEGVPAVEPAMS